jgi:cation-transporting ATPase 13A2
MIGDGANDCSAIREADIGISFSDADGSFSAPFTSMSTSLECVVKVLL